VFKGQSKVRLLPLGRLRSRKTKNPSLHPLKKKATTAVSRSRRRLFLVCSLPLSFHSALRFRVRRRQQRRRDPSSDMLHVAISSSVTIRYALYPYTFFHYLKSAEVWKERDEGCVAFKEATGALS
ncbi:hypothetical protein Taro_006871, partial [Colocasia esculenta]|nr:hypothetical protein [Colocasia esculenta]